MGSDNELDVRERIFERGDKRNLPRGVQMEIELVDEHKAFQCFIMVPRRHPCIVAFVLCPERGIVPNLLTDHVRHPRNRSLMPLRPVRFWNRKAPPVARVCDQEF